MRLRILLMIVLTVLFIASFFSCSHAQTKSKKEYRVWIKLIDGSAVDGILRQAGDSLIELMATGDTPVRIDVADIETLAVRRSNSVRKGIAIGAVLGGLTGLIIGIATQKEPEEPDPNNPITYPSVVASNEINKLQPLGGFFVGATGGALLGAAIGSSRKKFNIRGDHTEFKKFTTHIEKRKQAANK